jgi:hypothetical protein
MVGRVWDYGAISNDPDHDSALSEIMHLVNVPYGVSHDGWNRESARLFAIDTAMTATRRHMATLTEADRHSINAYLQEARTLVVAGRDSELGFLQAALESHLALAAVGLPRRLWLGAIDALIPSPYRAALVSTRNALSLGTTEAFTDLSKLLRDRLLARLGEGSLLSGPPSTLYLTA